MTDVGGGKPMHLRRARRRAWAAAAASRVQVPYIPILLYYHYHFIIIYQRELLGRRWLTSLQALVSP